MNHERDILGSDLRLLSERLEAVYAARSFGDLMRSSIELLRPFFAADYWCVGLCEPARRRVVAIGWPGDFPLIDYAARVRDLAEQSPLFQYWKSTRDHGRVLRRTDCCDESQFQSTGLYNELFRPLSLRQQIGTWLRPGGGRHMEIGMYRTGATEFSAADLERLALLRGHVLRAYSSLLERRSLSGQARTDDLPGDAFELQRTDLSSDLDADEQSERQATTDFAALQTPLTPRERDVLSLLVAGKTNQEIAATLGTKWRTVSKQFESIFRKLGVETRTAAAVRAIELNLHR